MRDGNNILTNILNKFKKRLDNILNSGYDDLCPPSEYQSTEF